MKRIIFFLFAIFCLEFNNVFSQTYIVIVSGSNPSCSGSAVTLGLSRISNQTNDWYANNTFIGIGREITVFPTQTTTYTATLAAGSSLIITVTPLPDNAGTISGTAIVCQGQNAVNYTVPVIANATSYYWTLPSGATGSSTTNNITVNYGSSAVSGNITVNGNNYCGNGAISNLAIIVNNIPSVSISNNGPVCTGNTLLLSASSTPVATYSWTGPNSFSSTSQNPTVSTETTTAMAGTYYVIATANGCISPADSTTVMINQATASNNGPICADNTLSLTASTISGATYFWTGPNGFVSTDQNPIVSTNASSAMSGVYNVYTTVNGCTSPIPGKTTAVVSPLPNTPSASNNSPVCVGDTLSLTASLVSGATYSWTGPNGFTSTQQNTMISSSATTAMAGVYYVAVTANGCTSHVDSTTVEINKITASNNGPVCTGNTTSLSATPITGAVYSWTGPNGFTSSLQTPTVSTNTTTAMEGVYTVNSTVHGCTSPTSVTIVLVNTIPPAPVVSTPVTYCQNDSVSQLTATGSNLLWYTTPTGSTGSTIAPTPVTTAAGTITYYVTQSNACESPKASIAVVVNPLPTANAKSSAAFACIGSSVTLSANAGAGTKPYTFALSTGAVSSNSLANINTDTIFSVIIKDINGCITSSNVAVGVNPLPTVSVVGDTICKGKSTIITASGANTYTWNHGLGFGTSKTVSPTTSTTYTVIGTDINGCTNFESGIILINPLPTLTTIGNNICKGDSTSISVDGASTYSWSNGLGNLSSVTVNPTTSITYTVTGVDTNGCVNTAHAIVIVNSLPTVNAKSSALSVCNGNSVTLSANAGVGTIPYTYAWSTGALPADTGISTATIIANSSYTVSVTDNNGCTATSSVSLVMNPLPTVSAQSSEPVACYGSSVTLSANAGAGTSPYTYVWSNKSPSNSSTVSAVITAYSIYTVTVMDINRCLATNSVSVGMNTLPTVSADGGTICLGNSQNVSASGASTYSWSNSGFGDIITVNSATTTTFTVTGTDGNGCNNTATAIVKVNNLPVVTAVGGTICQGNSQIVSANGANTYSWNTLESGVSINVSPTITTTYTVTGTDVNGCSNDTIAVVTVNTLPLVLAAGGTICQGNSQNIIASGAIIYSWNIGKSSDTISINPTITTTYTVTGTDGNGCLNTATAEVIVNTLPTVTAVGGTICYGSSQNVVASGANIYTWNNSESGDTISVNPLINTTYTVTGTDNNNCSNTANAVVSVISATATATPTIICVGNSSQISVSSGDSYQWSSGSCGTSQECTVSPTTNTTYTVTVIASGCTNIDSVVISVNALPIAFAGNDQTVCSGNNVTLIATGGSSYSWNNGVSNNVAFAPDSTAIYTVTVTDDNNCSNTDDVKITVNIISTPTIMQTGDSLVSIAISGNQWYFNNLLIPHDTTQSFIPDQNGNYFVIVTQNGCSSDTSTILNVSNVGIADLSSDKTNIHIFPNPITDKFTIEMNNQNGSYNLEILNAVGQVILNKKIINRVEQIDLSGQSAGVYFVKLQSVNSTITKKIIKQD